jgi:hypothetical protein
MNPLPSSPKASEVRYSVRDHNFTGLGGFPFLGFGKERGRNSRGNVQGISRGHPPLLCISGGFEFPMKTKLLLILFLSAAPAFCESALVVFTPRSATYGPLTNVLITIRPLSVPSSDGVGEQAINSITNRTGSSTNFATNLYTPGTYEISYFSASPNYRTIFTNSFPETNGTIYSRDFMTASVNVSNLIAYSRGQSDARYIQKTNGTGYGLSVGNLTVTSSNTPSPQPGQVLTFVASTKSVAWSNAPAVGGISVAEGTNMHLVTNGSVITINNPATGGSGDAGGTNARQFGSLTLSNISSTASNNVDYVTALTTLTNVANTASNRTWLADSWNTNRVAAAVTNNHSVDVTLKGNLTLNFPADAGTHDLIFRGYSGLGSPSFSIGNNINWASPDETAAIIGTSLYLENITDLAALAVSSSFDNVIGFGAGYAVHATNAHTVLGRDVVVKGNALSPDSFGMGFRVSVNASNAGAVGNYLTNTTDNTFDIGVSNARKLTLGNGPFAQYAGVNLADTNWVANTLIASNAFFTQRRASNYAHATSIAIDCGADVAADITNSTSANVSLLLTNIVPKTSGRLSITSDGSARTFSIFSGASITMLSTNETLNSTQIVTTASKRMVLNWAATLETPTKTNLLVWAKSAP